MSRLDAWSSGSNHRIGKHLFCLVVLSPLYRRFKAPFVFCKGSLLPRLRPRSFSFFLIAAAIPFLSFRTRGGGVGCRGGALTPAPVFPHVASPFRGAVRCAWNTVVGSGLALVTLRPGRRGTGSTLRRTRWHAGRGSNCQTGPGTPRRQESSSPFPCSAARNVDVTGKITPYVTPSRYG